jgi:hypothetical protein
MKRAVYIVVLLAHCCFSQFSYNPEQLISDLRILSADSLEGRRVGSSGSSKARTLIVNRLRELGVSPYGDDYLQPFPVTQSFGQPITSGGTNVLGVIEGKKSETFVISAHYDHVGIINNSIYNGADDNASGTAALLAIASYFRENPPDHRLIIAFFDGEEIGLKGSGHFVNTVDLDEEGIVLNVNMDMLSRSDTHELYVSGTYHHPELAMPLNGVTLPQGIRLLLGHDIPATGRDDWTNQSDHRNFHLKGIPFLYFGVEDHADYHKPTDEFEKINLEFYTASVETVLRAIIALDKSL